MKWFENHSDTYQLSIAWTVTISSVLAGIAPRLLVAVMIIYTLLAILFQQSTGKLDWQKTKSSSLLLTALAFAGYVFLSSLWTGWPLVAFQKGLWLVLIILAIVMALPFIKQAAPLQLHRAARGILLGLIIGMAFVFEEYASHFALLSFITAHVPGFAQTIGTTRLIPSYYLNNQVTALVLLLWPVLLIASLWKNNLQKKLIFPALLLPLLFITIKTDSATAQSALALSVAAFATARYAPRLMAPVVRVLWVLAVLGVIPIILTANHFGLQDNTALPYSFRDRMHIWDYTAKRIQQNPLLGIGIRSSRAHKIETHDLRTKHTRNGKLIDHPGFHSHNLFLQAWYELGAVGAAFLLALGLLITGTIENIAASKRPYAYAAFSSFAMVAAFGYGMWQSWLLAAYGWTTIFFLIAVQYGSKEWHKADIHL